jgi:hypothetical protein
MYLAACPRVSQCSLANTTSLNLLKVKGFKQNLEEVGVRD